MEDSCYYHMREFSSYRIPLRMVVGMIYITGFMVNNMEISQINTQTKAYTYAKQATLTSPN